MLFDSLAYPFRRANAAILGVAALFACLPPIVAFLLPDLPYVGLIAGMVELVVLGYLLLFLHSVMEATTKGEDEFPGWPDVTDASSMGSEVCHVLFPLVVSFLPLLGYVVGWAFTHGGDPMGSRQVAILAGLGALGLVYLPMAMLVFSFYGEWAMLNLVAVGRSIVRAWRDYLTVVVFLVGLGLAHAFLAAGVARLPAVLACPLAAGLVIYFLAVAMRAIGLLYRRNKARLGWE